MKSIKRICCIGAGYVGGPTMIVIADKCPQLDINVVDINEERIAAWNNSDLDKLPIYEPGLKEVLKKCRNRNLFFSNRVKENLAGASLWVFEANTNKK